MKISHRVSSSFFVVWLALAAGCGSPTSEPKPIDSSDSTPAFSDTAVGYGDADPDAADTATVTALPVRPDTIHVSRPLHPAHAQVRPNRRDSVERPESPTPAGIHTIPAKRSARMAYSYCPEMKRNEAADVNVYVSIVNPTSVVVDNLMRIVAQQHNPTTGKSDADSIIATNILLYKRMKVVLIDPESAFKIDSVYGKQWQTVDSMGDNRWRWSVIPKTDAKAAKLIIKVVAETPEGVIKDIDDRTFYVKVKLTPPIVVVRSWWSYLTDNPAMVVTVILIPLIAYFGKRYFDRKKGK